MLKLDTRRPQPKSVIRTHTTLGHRMISRIRLWEDLAPFVLHHHERWDGSGYPEGLAGETSRSRRASSGSRKRSTR
jgi:response regulator RpfG family c-di-GMP phosphodiesterase